MKWAVLMTMLLIVASVLPSSGVAQNASPPLGVLDPGAYVGKRDALFVFPVSDQSTWKWHQPGVRVGALEYGWSITVGDRPRYHLGFSLFKPGAAAAPDSGPLSEMLERGQLTLWRADSTGAALVALPPVDLWVIGLDGQILLHLDDEDVVQMLFGSRPREVAVSTTIEGARSLGVAAVQYTNSDLKLWSRPASGESLEVGETAPGFDLEVLSPLPSQIGSTRVTLADLSGEVIVLYFWTSQCPVSVEEFDAVVQRAEMWTQRGVRVVGITIRDDRSEAASFLATKPDSLIPHLLGHPAVEEAYGAWGTPYVVLIDRKGRVVYRAMSAGQWLPGGVLGRKLERLLAEQAVVPLALH